MVNQLYLQCRIVRCIALLFFLCFLNPLMAQKALPHVIPSEKVLYNPIPSNAYDIEIDSNNYLYFGGPAGVRRFNGIELEPIDIKGELRFKPALNFFKDAKERIWVKFLHAGISMISDSGCIPFKYSDTIRQFDRGHLEGLYEDTKGVLHLAPRGKGYFKVMPNGELKEVLTKVQNLHGFVVCEIEGKPFVFSTFASTEDERNKGLSIYYWREDDSISEITHIETVSPIHKSALVKYPNGNYMLSIGTKDLIKFREDSLIQHLQSPYNVTDIFLDRDETLWIGTDQNGVYQALDSMIDIEHPILSNTASAVTAQDKDGGLWIKSSEEYFYYMPSSKSKSYDEELSNLRELEFSFIDTDGDKVYLNYWGGKDLIVFEEDTVRRIPFPENVKLEVDFRTSSGPTTLEYDPIRKWIWVGFDCYVLAYDGKSWHSFVIPKETTKGNYRFRSMTIKPDGTLVAASYGGLLMVHLDGTTELMKMHPKQHGVYHMYLIESDQEGRLWIGAENGLWCLDGDTCFQPKIAKEFEKDINSFITFLHAGLGRMWFISHDRSLFSITGDTAEPFQINAHRKSLILDLTNDSAGNVWGRILEGDNNYFKIEKQNGNFQVKKFGQPILYERNAGLRQRVFTIARQKIYYQHGSQIFIQDLNEMDSASRNPTIVIEDIFINDLSVEKKSSYELESNQNSLRFYFNPISYTTGGVRYRHRLIGFSNQWRVSKVSSVQYTNLDPGKYQFEVEVKEVTNPWVDRKTIDIYIKTPFWQTWWFIGTIAILGIVLIGLMFYAWFRNRARRSELTIAKLMADQRALRAQMNPHFLFNTLVSIQELVFSSGPMVAAKNISLFATLMRKILIQSSQESISLSEEIEMLTMYVKLESLRFEDRFEYQFSIDGDIDPNTKMIPPMLIQPFVENSIKHGLQNKEPKGGAVKISFKASEGGILCVVDDNGVGRKVSSTKNKKNKPKSFSIEAVQERIQILNMRSGKELILNIIDKHGESGTRIELLLP